MNAARKLYLDKENAKLAGVCAGIADYMGWKPGFVRVAWIVATLFWAPVMIAAYLLMAWLLEPKPQADFARAYPPPPPPMPSDPAAPRRRFVDVKARFDRLETRLRALESVVTSRAFQIDRELKGR